MATPVYQRQVEKRTSIMRWGSHFYEDIFMRKLWFLLPVTMVGMCAMVGWGNGSWLMESHEQREEGRQGRLHSTDVTSGSTWILKEEGRTTLEKPLKRLHYQAWGATKRFGVGDWLPRRTKGVTGLEDKSSHIFFSTLYQWQIPGAKKHLLFPPSKYPRSPTHIELEDF